MTKSGHVVSQWSCWANAGNHGYKLHLFERYFVGESVAPGNRRQGQRVHPHGDTNITTSAFSSEAAFKKPLAAPLPASVRTPAAHALEKCMAAD
jgi:hypothetical protein